MHRLSCLGLLAGLSGLSPATLLAQSPVQTGVTITSTSETQSYGLFLVSDEAGCPDARFLVLGDGIEEISETLSPGEGTLLSLGSGFAIGPHGLTVMSIGCPMAPASVRLVLEGRGSPGHGRGVELDQIELVAGG